jgi:hypothetical protein
MNATFSGVFLSRFVPSPIRVSSTSPRRGIEPSSHRDYPVRALNGRHSRWFHAALRWHIGQRSGGTATATP